MRFTPHRFARALLGLIVVAAAPPGGLDAQPRPVYPGVGEPMVIVQDRLTLDLSAAPHGEADGARIPGGLLGIEDDGSGIHDLIYLFGEELDQLVTILENRSIRGLSDRGYRWGGPRDELYSVTVDLRLQLLVVDSITGESTLEDISTEEVFYESDLLVTDAGEKWVLAYDATGFRPRLFRKEMGGEWLEVNLGLQGIYLGGIFGRPESALVPEILDGRLYFWITRQLHETADELILVSYPVGTGAVPASGETATAKVIAELSAPADQTPGFDEDTAALGVGGKLVYSYFADERFNIAIYDPEMEASDVSVVDCPPGPAPHSISLMNSSVPNQILAAYDSMIERIEVSDFSPRLAARYGTSSEGHVLTARNTFRPEGAFDSTGEPDPELLQLIFLLAQDSSLRATATQQFVHLGETMVVPQVIRGASLMEVTNLSGFAGSINWYVSDQQGNRVDEGVAEVEADETFAFSVGGQFGSGYAVLSSDLKFMVQTTWQLKDRINSPDAGVAGQIGSTEWDLFGRVDGERQSGIAIANPIIKPNSCTLTLFRGGSHPPVITSMTMEPGAQTAAFLGQFFGVVSSEPETVGHVNVSCEHPVSVTAVTQETQSGALLATPAVASKRDFGHRERERIQ